MSLKTFLTSLNKYLPKKCPHGKSHFIRGGISATINNDKYCYHQECINIVLAKHKEQLGNTLGVGDGSGTLFVHGDYESIKHLQFKLLDLEKRRREKQDHVIVHDLKNRTIMDLQTLSDTLLEAREHLVGQLGAVGVVEARVRPFIHWYENVRDNRHGSIMDHSTYKTCKTITRLEDQILLVQQESQK